MNWHADQRELFAKAEGLVAKFLKERNKFTLFALVMQPDGEWSAVQPSDEFPTPQAALLKVSETLRSMAASGQITTSLICMPTLQEKGILGVIADMEHQASPPVIAILQYKKGLLSGWSLKSKEFVPGQSRVFVS